MGLVTVLLVVMNVQLTRRVALQLPNFFPQLYTRGNTGCVSASSFTPPLQGNIGVRSQQVVQAASTKDPLLEPGGGPQGPVSGGRQMHVSGTCPQLPMV